MGKTESKDHPRARSFAQFANMSQASMLEEISVGLPILVKSVHHLAEATEFLDTHRKSYSDKKIDRATSILALHLEEEAAKILMLIDMVRCPVKRKKDRSRLARNISSHLARLIYTEIYKYDWTWDNMSELREIIDKSRSRFYLDGPNGYEWIFPNELIFKRESSIYTDYYCWGSDNFHWHDPEEFCHRTFLDGVRFIQALWATGALSLQGLKIISQLWEDAIIDDKTTSEHAYSLNGKLLSKLQENECSKDGSDKDFAALARWHPPLYIFDLGYRDIDIAHLEELREKLFLLNEGFES